MTGRTAVLALAALLALPARAGSPLTKTQLLDLLKKGVDTSLVVSLVEKDCVAFDVDGSNLAELSSAMPPEVLKAAIECRKGRPAARPPTPPAAPVPLPDAATATAAAAAAAREERSPAPAEKVRLRVKSIRKLGDIYGIDEIRYPCDAPGQVWLQARRAFGKTKLYTLDLGTGQLSEGPPPCSPANMLLTTDTYGPADTSPDGRHTVYRNPGTCGYMDGKCQLTLDGQRISVEGTDRFKYPQFVWIDDRTLFLSNFGGLGGGPDGFWLLSLGEEKGSGLSN